MANRNPLRITPTTLLLDATAPTSGDGKRPMSEKRTFQAKGQTSAGAGACDVRIEGSNDNTSWVELGQITLTLSTSTSTDGFVSDSPWTYVRARVDSISGTGAEVTVLAGS